MMGLHQIVRNNREAAIKDARRFGRPLHFDATDIQTFRDKIAAGTPGQFMLDWPLFPRSEPAPKGYTLLHTVLVSKDNKDGRVITFGEFLASICARHAYALGEYYLGDSEPAIVNVYERA